MLFYTLLGSGINAVKYTFDTISHVYMENKSITRAFDLSLRKRLKYIHYKLPPFIIESLTATILVMFLIYRMVSRKVPATMNIPSNLQRRHVQQSRVAQIHLTCLYQFF